VTIIIENQKLLPENLSRPKAYAAMEHEIRFATIAAIQRASELAKNLENDTPA
jgi:hypothetical protein